MNSDIEKLLLNLDQKYRSADIDTRNEMFKRLWPTIGSSMDELLQVQVEQPERPDIYADPPERPNDPIKIGWRRRDTKNRREYVYLRSQKTDPRLSEATMTCPHCKAKLKLKVDYVAEE